MVRRPISKGPNTKLGQGREPTGEVDKLDIDRGNTGETRRVRSQKLYLDNEHYRELYMELRQQVCLSQELTRDGQ